MTANDLRSMYIEFFKSKNHAEISGQSLIPENDPSVLFTTAGMHRLFLIFLAKNILQEHDLQIIKNVSVQAILMK